MLTLSIPDGVAADARAMLERVADWVNAQLAPAHNIEVDVRPCELIGFDLEPIEGYPDCLVATPRDLSGDEITEDGGAAAYFEEPTTHADATARVDIRIAGNFADAMHRNNPAMSREDTLEQLAAVLLHEVGHYLDWAAARVLSEDAADAHLARLLAEFTGKPVTPLSQHEDELARERAVGDAVYLSGEAA